MNQGTTNPTGRTPKKICEKDALRIFKKILEIICHGV